MKHQTKVKLIHLGYIFFCICLFLTIFLPTISLDCHYEYEGYYSIDYSSHSEAICSRISPYMMIEAMLSSKEKYVEIKEEYELKYNYYTTSYLAGNISEEELKTLLAKDKTINKYYIYGIRYDDIPELSRLNVKTTLLYTTAIIFYAVCLLSIFLNILNYFDQNSTLTIAGIFCGWIMAILYLFYIIINIAFAIQSTTIIEGYSSKITEIRTTCANPHSIMFVFLLLMIAYSIIQIIFEKKEAQFIQETRELTLETIKKINEEKLRNKYRPINSKKSKYKHGSKKKRRN